MSLIDDKLGITVHVWVLYGLEKLIMYDTLHLLNANKPYQLLYQSKGISEMNSLVTQI